MEEKANITEARATYEKLKKNELTDEGKNNILQEVNQKTIKEVLYLKQIVETELAVSKKPVASIWSVILSICALLVSIFFNDKIFDACSKMIITLFNTDIHIGTIIYFISYLGFLAIILVIAVLSFKRSKPIEKELFIKNVVDVRIEILEKTRTEKPQKNVIPIVIKANCGIAKNNTTQTHKKTSSNNTNEGND